LQIEIRQFVSILHKTFALAF